MTTITIERALLEQIIQKFEYCGCEVCTRQSIEAIRAALAAPAVAPAQPERKPMTFAEKKLAFLELDSEASYKDFTDGIDAAEAFHGIKEDKP